MFDRIINPSSDIFDADTGAYIGKAHFSFLGNAERALLDYLNYGLIPTSLLLMDVDIDEVQGAYLVTDPYERNHRAAALYAVARDRDSGLYMPFVMRLRYDTVTRGNLSGNVYHADSVELSNIEPVDIIWIRVT